MKEIVCSIDITLKLPPNFRGVYPNETETVIDFTAGVPKSVDDFIAEWFTENDRGIFTYTTSGMNNFFGSESLTVQTTPTRCNVHAFAKWTQFMNESDTAIYIGGKDVTVGTGWAELLSGDTTEKYFEKQKNIWLVASAATDVKVLWGSDR